MKKTLFAVTLLALATPALAREDAASGVSTEGPVVSVRHADLDLTSQRGAEIMMARLKRAASNVCGEAEAENPSGALRREMAACKEAALSEAVATLDAARVTELYRAASVQTVAYRR